MLKISLIYNVNGKLSDKLFEQMLHDFELELDGLNTSITQDQQELDRISSESVNAEKFIALVKRYTDFSELTPAMINEFIHFIWSHGKRHYSKDKNSSPSMLRMSSIGIFVPSCMVIRRSKSSTFMTAPVAVTYAPPALRSSGLK